MTRVLQLVCDLDARPSMVPVAGVCVRPYEGPVDIDRWLALRRGAFAKEEFGVRPWTRAECEREILAKSWWKPNRMWLAENDDQTLVGTVTLAERGAGAKPVVHWLAVLPPWRRLGVGSLLMTALEAHVWDHGERRIWLDTHARWRSALALYEARGYRPTEQ